MSPSVDKISFFLCWKFATLTGLLKKKKKKKTEKVDRLRELGETSRQVGGSRAGTKGKNKVDSKPFVMGPISPGGKRKKKPRCPEAGKGVLSEENLYR